MSDDVYVNNGTAHVDLDHSRYLLSSYQLAQTHLANASDRAAELSNLLNSQSVTPSCAAALRHVQAFIWGPGGLAFVQDRLAETADQLRRSINHYETLSYDRLKVLEHVNNRMLSTAEKLGLIITGVFGGPGAVLMALKWRVHWTLGNDLRAGKGWNSAVQRQVTDLATVMGSALNLFGNVRTRSGVHSQRDMLAVPFLAATLLRMSGIDGRYGNYHVSLAGTSVPGLFTRSRHKGELASPTHIPELAGTLTTPVKSHADVFKRVDALGAATERTKLGHIQAIQQTGENGKKAWLFIVPGMDGTLGGTSGRGWEANLQLMGDADSNIVGAFQDAMQMLPIGEGDSIVIYGHSQGGMVAMDVAKSAQQPGGITVDGVVTCGSPIGQFGQLDDKSALLAVEDANDLVPALDGVANEASPRHVTAIVDTGTENPLLAHTSANCVTMLDSATKDTAVAPIDNEIAGRLMFDEPWVVAREFTFEIRSRD